MEDSSWRAAATAAVAPVVWGSTYIVTGTLLPEDRPLFSAVIRALPAGLVLLGLQPRLPQGDWWWKAAVLGLCNIGLFFPLIFLSAYNLPGGLAATVQATSPLAVMALAYVVLGERATALRIGGAVIGLLGVALLVLGTPEGVTALGLAAAAGSVVVSGLGFVLIKRWPSPVPMRTLVSWQLVVGGTALLPVALVVEGAPPALDLPAIGGYLWVGGAGTALAYTCWFSGLSRMPAGAVALIGLLNPVTGTVLGVALAAEPFGIPQLVGMALVLAGVVAGQRRAGGRAAAPAVEPAARGAAEPAGGTAPEPAAGPVQPAACGASTPSGPTAR